MGQRQPIQFLLNPIFHISYFLIFHCHFISPFALLKILKYPQYYREIMNVNLIQCLKNIKYDDYYLIDS